MSEAAIQPGVDVKRHPKVLEACSRMRVAGLRITQARMAMIELMVRSPQPLSAEEIHEGIGGTCDLVTVYRSTAHLCEIGLFRRIFSRMGTSLYQLELEPEHYQVVARDGGGRIVPIEAAPSPEMRLVVQAIEDQLRQMGYTHVTHVIQFFADEPKA